MDTIYMIVVVVTTSDDSIKGVKNILHGTNRESYSQPRDSSVVVVSYHQYDKHRRACCGYRYDEKPTVPTSVSEPPARTAMIADIDGRCYFCSLEHRNPTKNQNVVVVVFFPNLLETSTSPITSTYCHGCVRSMVRAEGGRYGSYSQVPIVAQKWQKIRQWIEPFRDASVTR